MRFSYPSISTALYSLVSIMALQVDARTKTFVTPDNYKWTYDHVRADAGQPTFLLLHGFPSSRKDWHHQVEDLSRAGYGVIVPDILGYGDSDRPVDIKQYRLKSLSRDLDAILGHEGLDTVIGVGHDWGSNVLSSTVVYYPQRFEKLVWLSVGYAPPGFFDVDGVNANGLKTLGYTPFGYWYFFNSFDAADVIREHIDSAWHLVFPDDDAMWRDNLASIGGTRAWLNNDNTTAIPYYRTKRDKAAWIKHYSKPGNLEASLNTYRSLMRGINAADYKTVTEEQKILKVPVLGIPSAQDVVARPENVRLATEPYASKGYTEKPLEAGHWAMLERAKELSKILIDFASEKE